MDVVHAWANGASFAKLCEMTDVFEGKTNNNTEVIKLAQFSNQNAICSLWVTMTYNPRDYLYVWGRKLRVGYLRKALLNRRLFLQAV